MINQADINLDDHKNNRMSFSKCGKQHNKNLSKAPFLTISKLDRTDTPSDVENAASLVIARSTAEGQDSAADNAIKSDTSNSPAPKNSQKTKSRVFIRVSKDPFRHCCGQTKNRPKNQHTVAIFCGRTLGSESGALSFQRAVWS